MPGHTHHHIWLFRGAMLCVVKSKRKDKHAEALTQDYIITRKFSFIMYLETHPLNSKPADLRPDSRH